MTTSLKDVSTAIMIGQLADLNAFEREYDVWGYGWLTSGGKVNYALSDNPTGLRRMREEQRIQGLAMSPLKKHAERAIVRGEDLDDWLYERKLRLAVSIRAEYPFEYYEIIARVVATSCDDAALDVLLPWKDEITGYFDEAPLDLFEGALREARAHRHMSVERFHELHAWLQHEKRQVLNAGEKTGANKRTFYGVAYKENGATRFYANANADAFYDRLDAFDEQGIKRSPIYTRAICHEKAASGVIWRKEFVDHLQACMDEAYLGRIAALNALPSAIADEVWADALEWSRRSCTPEAQEALVRWGAQMNRAM